MIRRSSRRLVRTISTVIAPPACTRSDPGSSAEPASRASSSSLGSISSRDSTSNQRRKKEFSDTSSNSNTAKFGLMLASKRDIHMARSNALTSQSHALQRAISMQDTASAWYVYLSVDWSATTATGIRSSPLSVPQMHSSLIRQIATASGSDLQLAGNYSLSQAVTFIIKNMVKLGMEPQADDVASLMQCKLFHEKATLDTVWSLLLEHWPALFGQKKLRVGVRGYAYMLRAAVRRGGSGMRDVRRIYQEMSRANEDLDDLACAAFMKEFRTADYVPGAKDLRRRISSLSLGKSAAVQRTCEDFITTLARAGDYLGVQEEVDSIRLAKGSVTLSMVNNLLSCRSKNRLPLHEVFSEFFGVSSSVVTPLRPSIATLSIIVQDALQQFREGAGDDKTAALIDRCRALMANSVQTEPTTTSLETHAITVLLDAVASMPAAPLSSDRLAAAEDPSKICFQIILSHFNKSSQPNAAKWLISHLRSTNRTPDAAMFASLSAALIRGGGDDLGDRLNEVSEEMNGIIEHPAFPSSQRFGDTTLINSLTSTGRKDEAVSVFENREWFRIDSHVIVALLSAVSSRKDLRQRVFGDDLRKGLFKLAGDGVISNRHVLSSLFATNWEFNARGGLRDRHLPFVKGVEEGVVEEASELVSGGSVVDAPVLTSALRRVARRGDPESVRRLVELLGVSESSEANVIVFAMEAFSTCGDLESVKKFRRYLAQKTDVKENVIVRARLAELWACVKEGLTSEVDAILRDVITYATLSDSVNVPISVVSAVEGAIVVRATAPAKKGKANDARRIIKKGGMVIDGITVRPMMEADTEIAFGDKECLVHLSRKVLKVVNEVMPLSDQAKRDGVSLRVIVRC